MPLNGINLLIPPQTFTMTNANASSIVQAASTTTNHQPPQPLQQQQFCLRWTNYHSNLSTVFDQLYQAESFADVTLISEGRPIRAHKMVLAASSPYFQTIFNETPCKHPVVIIKDVRYEELKALVDFMYRGEINVAQEHIRPLLKLAEMFQIRGLTEVTHEEEALETTHNGVPVEQFTIYTAFSNEEPAQTKSEGDPTAKKRSSKERELSRKQTLETLDVPVEWPSEEAVRIKPPRKRKSQPEAEVDDNAINNFEPNNAFQNMPSSVAALATVMVQPPAPSPAQSVKLEVATSFHNIQQQQLAPPAEDSDTKMSFLDSTNEDISAANSPDPWTTTTATTTTTTTTTDSSRHSSHASSKQQKAPAWNWSQLQEAIAAVVTQRLRFTQASAKYNIPKGTLYDNILGKSHRMAVLQELPLNAAEEAAVLDFCCDTSISPYNKRTKKSLKSILEFLARFDTFRAKEDKFGFGSKGGFRWWWAFCRKHSIVSLYFEGMAEDDKAHLVRYAAAKKNRKSGGVDVGVGAVATGLAVK
uniref:BTB domain-containing protein n=1 Tax=Culex tarsalis TaxID=7177 RepID=A0A1Q3F5Q1_CULTA